MPFSKCPICGNISHLNVGNVEKWYADRSRPIGSLVVGKCFDCWGELKVGDTIVVRASFGNESPVPLRTQCVIEEVFSADEEGTLFRARLPSGIECYFIRAEIRKLREGEA
jgi:hypothetical protein